MHMRNSQRRRTILTALVMATVALAYATSLQAQSVVDPTMAEFVPSTDHNVITNGTAVVSRYDLGFFLVGAPQPFQTEALGKPTPAADGLIHVTLSSVALPSPGIVYESRVFAVGPGGSAPSDVSNTFMFSVPCTYAAAPMTQSVPVAGGPGTVNVTASGGCAWTAASNANWLTISAGAAGTGNGAVSFNAAANTATTARSGTLVVAGTQVTVNQPAASCTYGATPATQTVVVAGGAVSVSVTSQSGCGWTATSGASWLTVSSNGSGSGNATVGLTAAPNGTTTQRSTTVSVGGTSVSVVQPGNSCSYSLSPATQSTPAAGGAASVGVTTLAGCSWTATSGASWLTISTGANGSGSGTVSLNATANPTTQSRATSVSVAGQSVQVTQLAGSCTFSSSPMTLSFPAAGGSATGNVTAASGCTWTASSPVGWLTITSGGNGNGNGNYGVSAAQNNGSSNRSASLSVAGLSISVSQPAASGCSFTVTPTNVRIGGNNNSSGSVTVAGGSGCAWTAVSNAAWLTVSSGASGSGNGNASFKAPKNSTGADRVGTLTVAGQTITVTQSQQGKPGAPAGLKVVTTSQ